MDGHFSTGIVVATTAVLLVKLKALVRGPLRMVYLGERRDRITEFAETLSSQGMLLDVSCVQEFFTLEDFCDTGHYDLIVLDQDTDTKATGLSDQQIVNFIRQKRYTTPIIQITTQMETLDGIFSATIAKDFSYQAMISAIICAIQDLEAVLHLTEEMCIATEATPKRKRQPTEEKESFAPGQKGVKLDPSCGRTSIEDDSDSNSLFADGDFCDDFTEMVSD